MIGVTGAKGFLGSHVLRFFSRHSQSIAGFTHTPEGHFLNDSLVLVDYNDPDHLIFELKKRDIEVLIHVACPIPKNYEESRDVYLTTVRLDRAVISAARESGVKHFIYISTTGIYGMSSIGRVDETSPIQLENYYYLAKLIGEYTTSMELGSNSSTTVFRICAPYGLGQTSKTVLQVFVERARKGYPLKVLGKGTRRQQFVHVNDICRAISAAIAQKKSGLFNIAGPRSISMKELADLVVDIFGGPGSTVELDPAQDGNDDYRIEIDQTLAKRELNFQPEIDIREGIVELKNSAPPLTSIK